MARRKTFKIEDLKQMVNERNAKSTCSAEVREGWNSLLERVLFDTNNYRGFNYLPAGSVPAGQLPGIIFDEAGTGKHEYPDDSRRFYY